VLIPGKTGRAFQRRPRDRLRIGGSGVADHVLEMVSRRLLLKRRQVPA